MISIKLQRKENYKNRIIGHLKILIRYEINFIANTRDYQRF